MIVYRFPNFVIYYSMGNTTSDEAVTQAETLRIKKLTYEADNFSYSL